MNVTARGGYPRNELRESRFRYKRSEATRVDCPVRRKASSSSFTEAAEYGHAPVKEPQVGRVVRLNGIPVYTRSVPGDTLSSQKDPVAVTNHQGPGTRSR